MLELAAPVVPVAAAVAVAPKRLAPRAEPAPQPVLPYQTPPAYMEPTDLCRENSLVMAPRNAPFPMRCVKCNAPVEADAMKSQTMYWQHPAYYLTLLLGVLIGAIILLCVRQSTQVTTGLCNVHRAKRRNLILIGWAIALGGLAMWVLAILSWGSDEWRHSSLIPFLWLIGVVMVFGSLLWAVFAIPKISVRRIADKWVWFGGAGEEFLASLPVQR